MKSGTGGTELADTNYGMRECAVVDDNGNLIRVGPRSEPILNRALLVSGALRSSPSGSDGHPLMGRCSMGSGCRSSCQRARREHHALTGQEVFSPRLGVIAPEWQRRTSGLRMLSAKPTDQPAVHGLYFQDRNDYNACCIPSPSSSLSPLRGPWTSGVH